MTKNLSISSNTRCCSWFTPRLLEIQRMKNTRCTVACRKAQSKCFVFFMHSSTIWLSSAVKILAAVLIAQCAPTLTTAFILCSSLDAVGGSYFLWFTGKLNSVVNLFFGEIDWVRICVCFLLCRSVCVWGLGYHTFVRMLWTPELCISHSKKEWRVWEEENRKWRRRWQL